MNELLLKTDRLTKQYGQHKAVNEVSLHIKRAVSMVLSGETAPAKPRF